MKTKAPVTLLVIAIPLLLLGIFFISKRVLPTATTSQAQTLSDWQYGSAGTLKVMVSYPTHLFTNRKSLITVTYQADPTLEANLSNGYVFDAELESDGSVITPQKRRLTPVEPGRHSFSWELVPFAVADIDGVIQLALGGSNLNGTYAISPQTSFALPFTVMQSNGLNSNSTFAVGLVMIGLSILLFFIHILQKRNSSGAKA